MEGEWAARLRRYEVVSKRPGYVTVAVTDEHGGARNLELGCPPHFSPDVGAKVMLALTGPVPAVYPETIAADSITAREIIAGAITALLIQGDLIRTAETGGRVEIDSAGIRLYNAANALVSNLDTATGSALITGRFQTALTGSRVVMYQNTDGKQVLDFYYSTAPNPARITVGPDAFASSPQLLLQSNPASATAAFIKIDQADGVVLDADKYRVEARSDSVYVGSQTAGDAYLDFVDQEIGLHSGSMSRLGVNQTGSAWNGNTPIARRTVNAAATTTVEALALLNQIRQYLIDHGDCQ